MNSHFITDVHIQVQWQAFGKLTNTFNNIGQNDIQTTLLSRLFISLIAHLDISQMSI